MKSRIITGLTSLINAGDLEEKVNLQITVSHLILVADLGLEEEKEQVAKAQIISSLKEYVESSDDQEVHRQIIEAHIAFIESRLVA